MKIDLELKNKYYRLYTQKILLFYFYYDFIKLNNGDWGLGIGDWGLGPQSPIPNPHVFVKNKKVFLIMKFYCKYIIFI